MADNIQTLDLETLKQINNPRNEPTGPYTGRCGRCGSKDLWEDETVYGCRCCGKTYNNQS